MYLFSARTHLELYNKFDSSEMAFNPPIPPPKKIEFKDIKGRHFWNQRWVELRCEEALNLRLPPSNGFIDFAAEYRSAIRNNKTKP